MTILSDAAKKLSINAGVIAASATLLTGCLKKDAQPRTAPETSADVPSATMPAAPRVTADPHLVSFFLDQKVPNDVKAAILNQGAHAALKEVLDSGISSPAMTYRRDAYAPEIGQDAVRVLQHLLNEARVPTQQKGLKFIEQLKVTAATQMSPYKERTLEEIGYRTKWFKNPPPAVSIDGDYGRQSHTLRAFITQSENDITGGRFPHNKQDSGSSDTGIGPKTLKLLLRDAPEIKRALESPYETVEISFQKAKSE